MAKKYVAIMYDFDKTLSTTDMQNYSFIPQLGLTPEEFWGKTGEFSKKTGVERILSYMYMMISEAKAKGIKIDRNFLNECGKNIEFYPGVKTWFDRINKYGEEKGITVEHYLVSSGTIEIVEGCSIYDKFTKAYGCEYYYVNGEPVWPKLAINYTQKTQFIFRIAKGAFDTKNDNDVNAKTLELRVPYENIIYLGDGMTDIACMTLLNKNKGTSIAVYPKNQKEKVQGIKDDNRCRFLCEADYSAGSELEKVIKLVIDESALRYQINKKEEILAKK